MSLLHQSLKHTPQSFPPHSSTTTIDNERFCAFVWRQTAQPTNVQPNRLRSTLCSPILAKETFQELRDARDFIPLIFTATNHRPATAYGRRRKARWPPSISAACLNYETICRLHISLELLRHHQFRKTYPEGQEDGDLCTKWPSTRCSHLKRDTERII